MYILFTESHEILTNSVYVFHTYERRRDGGMKTILFSTQVRICDRYKWNGNEL